MRLFAAEAGGGDALGLFTLERYVDSVHRPVYRNEVGRYLYYNGGKQRWVVGGGYKDADESIDLSFDSYWSFCPPIAKVHVATIASSGSDPSHQLVGARQGDARDNEHDSCSRQVAVFDTSGDLTTIFWKVPGSGPSGRPDYISAAGLESLTFDNGNWTWERFHTHESTKLSAAPDYAQCAEEIGYYTWADSEDITFFRGSTFVRCSTPASAPLGS